MVKSTENFINLDLNYGDNYEGVEQRWCKKYKKYQRHMVDEDNTLASCKKKCDSLDDDCDAIAIGEGKEKGKKYNCTTYKNCRLSDKGTSISWTKNGKFEFFKQVTGKEKMSLHVLFLMILIFQMFIMVGYGAMIISRSLRKNM